MGEAKYKLRSVPPVSSLEELLEITQLSDHNMTTIHRRTLDTLDAFAELDADQSMVLFSPAIPNPTVGNMDPFEPFGKALAQHHQRVMHVPYVPQDGLVDFHKLMLNHASAAIIVIAEPAESTEADSKLLPKHSLKKQLIFVDALLKERAKLSDEVPLILIIVITTTDLWKELSGLRDLSQNIDTVLRASSYDDATLEKLAKMVFVYDQDE